MQANLQRRPLPHGPFHTRHHRPRALTALQERTALRTFDSDFEEDLYAARLQTLDRIANLAASSASPPTPKPTIPTASPAPASPTRIPAVPRAPTTAPQPKQFDRSPRRRQALKSPSPAASWPSASRAKPASPSSSSGGKRLQIYVRKDDVGEDAFALYKLLDLGDHIGVRGHLLRTRTGELT